MNPSTNGVPSDDTSAKSTAGTSDIVLWPHDPENRRRGFHILGTMAEPNPLEDGGGKWTPSLNDQGVRVTFQGSLKESVAPSTIERDIKPGGRYYRGDYHAEVKTGFTTESTAKPDTLYTILIDNSRLPNNLASYSSSFPGPGPKLLESCTMWSTKEGIELFEDEDFYNPRTQIKHRHLLGDGQTHVMKAGPRIAVFTDKPSTRVEMKAASGASDVQFFSRLVPLIGGHLGGSKIIDWSSRN